MARKDRLPIIRKGAGRGFYYEQDSQRITDEQELSRIKGLAIPPAWNHVRIARSPRAKVQAVGVDAAGRTQSIYNPVFRARQDEAKFARMLEFGTALPQLRAQVRKDLRRRSANEQKVAAAVIALIDEHLLRVGTPARSGAGVSFGATTLRRKHVKPARASLKLEFTGKSGQPQSIRVSNPKLMRILEELKDMPGHELFRFLDENHHAHRMDADRVNSYLRQAMGGPFTAKDFRTWGGTTCALQAMLEVPGTAPQRPEQLAKHAVETAAAKLGNTPTIARESYIDPRVLLLCEEPERLDRLRRSYRQLKTRHHLNPAERCLLRVLRTAP